MEDKILDQVLMSLRIITVGLILGVVMFLVIVLLFVRAGEPWAPLGQFEIITLMALGMGLVAIPISFVVGMVFKQKAAHEVESKRLPILQSRSIICQAILEGAALFNAIALLTEGSPWSLGMVAVLLIVMATNFPTRASLTVRDEVNPYRDDDGNR